MAAFPGKADRDFISLFKATEFFRERTIVLLCIVFSVVPPRLRVEQPGGNPASAEKNIIKMPIL